MAISKLRELAGTRYFYGRTIGQLENALEQALKNGDTLDLNQCRFNSAFAVSKLAEYYGKVPMINSESPELEAYLKHNCDAATHDYKLKDAVELRYTPVGKSEFAAYVNNFDLSKKYYINPNSPDAGMTKLFAAFLMAVKPSVVIDAGTTLSDIFEIIRADWLPVRGFHNSYWEVLNGTVLVERKVVKGKVYVPMVGEMDESEFVNARVVLPYVYSNRTLKNDEEFQRSLKNLIRRLTTIKVGTKKMKDYIMEKEN